MSPTIWLDGDACPRPIKELVFKASTRTATPVVVVANQAMRLPHTPRIRLVVVSSAFDAADSYIVEQCQAGDLVITADIPLADLVVARGALALNPRGTIYTAHNIKEQLSMRNLMNELRGDGMCGQLSGGPSAFGPRDIKAFAASFDRLLHAALRHRVAVR